MKEIINFEIINFARFIFQLFSTPYVIVMLLILVGLYAAYIFICDRVLLSVATVIKLIVYPFLFIYGCLMLVIAKLLEKHDAQLIGGGNNDAADFCFIFKGKITSEA